MTLRQLHYKANKKGIRIEKMLFGEYVLYLPNDECFTGSFQSIEKYIDTYTNKYDSLKVIPCKVDGLIIKQGYLNNVAVDVVIIEVAKSSIKIETTKEKCNIVYKSIVEGGEVVKTIGQVERLFYLHGLCYTRV